MGFLAATDPDFEQLIAVDRKFIMFTRAWCVAEMAEASECGLKQNMKIWSNNSLQEQKQFLKGLKIEEMSASRPEDIQDILAKIHDTASFNDRLQKLIFDDL